MDNFEIKRVFNDKKQTLIVPNYSILMPYSQNNDVILNFFNEYFEDYFTKNTFFFSQLNHSTRATFVTQLLNNYALYSDISLIFEDSILKNISIVPSLIKIENDSSILGKNTFFNRKSFGIEPIKCFECKTESYDNALDIAYSSIIFSKSIKEVLENKSLQGFIKSQSREVSFYNPTIKRATDYSNHFESFLDYIGQNKREIMYLRDYIKSMGDIKHTICHLDVNSSSRKYLEKMIEDTLNQAEETLSKIRPIDLGLENFF